MVRVRKLLNRRQLVAGAGAGAVVLAAPAIARAQAKALKVGVLLPRSGLKRVMGRKISAVSISRRRFCSRWATRNSPS